MLKGLINRILRIETESVESDHIVARIEENINDELEVTVDLIKNSGTLQEIIDLLNDVNFQYDALNDKLNYIRTNLISDKFVSTLRIVRWDGKVITQKGTVIGKNSRVIPIYTVTGEYGMEVVLSLRPKEDVKFKLLWIGLDYAGKTTLLHRLRYNEYISPKRTVGQELEDVVIEGLKITNIDLGGQKALRSHWAKFPLLPQIIVFVIDLCDEDRFEEAYAELKIQIVDNERFDNIPLLIVVNKIDNFTKEVDPVTYLTERIPLFNLLGERSWQIQTVSALTGEGLNDVIEVLTGYLVDQETR